MSRTSKEIEAGTENDNNLAEVLRMITTQLDAIYSTLVEQRRTNRMNVQLDEDDENKVELFFKLELKCCIRFHVQRFVGGTLEDAWAYHRSIQFDACFREFVSSLPCQLGYFIDRNKLERHVSFPMEAR
ncbi:hypothetical protein HAX54_006741 [Datura stramonium]|uniref:Uncharacterized protein n=1 Tax=Datura stramonium TaxID=4076 RepID=A0ABS8TBY0_DATST|nr:hypothetical protein [Datura stramonium]